MIQVLGIYIFTANFMRINVHCISSSISSSNSVTEYNLPAHPTELFALQTAAGLIGSNAEYACCGRMAKFYAGTGETAKASVILILWKRHLSLRTWRNQIPQISSICVCRKMSEQCGDLLSASCHQIMEEMVNMMFKHQMLGARIAAPFGKTGSIRKWWDMMSNRHMFEHLIFRRIWITDSLTTPKCHKVCSHRLLMQSPLMPQAPQCPGSHVHSSQYHPMSFE